MTFVPPSVVWSLICRASIVPNSGPNAAPVARLNRSRTRAAFRFRESLAPPYLTTRRLWRFCIPFVLLRRTLSNQNRSPLPNLCSWIKDPVADAPCPRSRFSTTEGSSSASGGQRSLEDQRKSPEDTLHRISRGAGCLRLEAGGGCRLLFQSISSYRVLGAGENARAGGDAAFVSKHFQGK